MSMHEQEYERRKGKKSLREERQKTTEMETKKRRKGDWVGRGKIRVKGNNVLTGRQKRDIKSQ